MKTLCMLPLLLAPIAGYGQANLFQQAPIGAVAPIKTYGADAGIGKGFKLAFSTLFFPDKVKNEWPVYGYRISNISDLCDKDHSVYKEISTTKKAALVRPRQDLSDNAKAYLGVPIRPTEGGSIMRRMEEICTGIEQSGLARKLSIYNTNDLPSGIWGTTNDSPSEEVLPEEAIPLLSGTLTTSHVSEQDYSMVWTLSESPNPDIPNMKVGWMEYDPMSAERRQSWDTVWEYIPPEGTAITGTYYLAKTGGNSGCDEIQTANLSWSSWAGEIETQGICFTSDSSYSIWHSPGEPQQSVDDWFFVTDEPLPRAEADIRIDPFE